MEGASDPERADALEQYKNKLLELREWEAKLKALRLDIKGLQAEFDTTEDNIKALQSVGQIIGEVLKQLDEERCKYCCVEWIPSGSSPWLQNAKPSLTDAA
jgi:26S proteasome regulatory subunit T4